MRFPLLAAAVSLPFGLPVLADTQTVTLDPLVVTATRTPETEDQTLASVSVIDRAEIERRQFRSVPDALRGLPGVSVSGSGGAGQPASLFLRGTNAGHVLVLIDGVKVGSATLGTAPLQDLPIAQIERIEVVRGPRSSLYGSEAIGGVIQIFTRRGGGPLRPRFSVGAGSFDTASVAGGVSGGGEHAWFDLGANLEYTDGINACDGRAFPFAGCGVDEPDRDGYRNLGLSARAGYEFSDKAKVDVSLLTSDNRTDFDGSVFSGNLSRSDQQVLGVEGTLRPLEPWTLILSAGRSQDSYRAFYADTFVPERFVDSFETERDSFGIQNDLALIPDQLFTLGLDYQVDRISGTVDYTDDSRSNTGVYGQYLGSIGANEIAASVRYDDYEQFGGQTTGNAAWGYLFDQGIRVSMSYGTAFKAPTFNDLYYPGFGNPNLSPEESASLELGLTGVLPLGRWELSLYETDIDDLIAFDSVTYAPANIASARIRGFEASGTLRIQDWDLGASLTLLDPENRSSGPNQGNLLPRRPEQMVQLDLDRRFERWSAGLSLYVAGRTFDDLANSERLDGYTLLGLRAEYAITPAVSIQGRLENALDEDYQTAYLFNQPGRAFYLTLRYEP
ncbi:TonB-dependent vitamin B12 receptor [Thiocapsa roseopersicina]|uniref:Vitamin B12 transporter n=1 Tax=Thiocapsa roseopersicina TaxID=1058 RepID=A0A1H2RTX0_THIRO|nr:TonB-dependent vitamin B12 receptor [Thiocapsa roseopersicina]SDW22630.1 vitamin B12 transporter [Thiocapsa roseopersicina]